MAKLNILKLGHLAPPRTHERGPAKAITPEQALRRSVLACMLWEDEFYEDGVQIAGRIRELVPKVGATKVAGLAIEAREVMKLRHAPCFWCARWRVMRLIAAWLRRPLRG
jgi:60 kDa SS-A/Ro ribonucleoprotein